MSEEDHYTPERAAKALAVEPEDVYGMLESGELEGELTERPGYEPTWRIPARAVHDRLPDEPPEQDRRRSAQPDPRVEDLPLAPPGS